MVYVRDFRVRYCHVNHVCAHEIFDGARCRTGVVVRGRRAFSAMQLVPADVRYLATKIVQSCESETCPSASAIRRWVGDLCTAQYNVLNGTGSRVANPKQRG